MPVKVMYIVGIGLIMMSLPARVESLYLPLAAGVAFGFINPYVRGLEGLSQINPSLAFCALRACFQSLSAAGPDESGKLGDASRLCRVRSAFLCV